MDTSGFGLFLCGVTHTDRQRALFSQSRRCFGLCAVADGGGTEELMGKSLPASLKNAKKEKPFD